MFNIHMLEFTTVFIYVCYVQFPKTSVYPLQSDTKVSKNIIKHIYILNDFSDRNREVLNLSQHLII